MLEGCGIQLITQWECLYQREKEENKELQKFLETYARNRPRDRLTLRDGLRGGRCESYRHRFSQADSGGKKKLYYFDINRCVRFFCMHKHCIFFLSVCLSFSFSLYPWAALTFAYPCGIPTTYLGENIGDLGLDRERGFYNKVTGQKLSGLVQCTMLAPGNLYLPCLAVSMDGKLKFSLCAACAKEERSGLCDHSDSERALTSTWTTEEIRYAVFECGYELVHTYEAFLYKEVRTVEAFIFSLLIIFPKLGIQEKKIFQEFYSHLAMMKLESEGFPKGVATQAEKEAYCMDLNQRMPGLALDPSRVRRNMARRNFAKLLSNATLGVFSFCPFDF